MFDSITIPALYAASVPRTVYDNPPAVMDVPRFPRARALAARLAHTRRTEPARASQPLCGAQGR